MRLPVGVSRVTALRFMFGPETPVELMSFLMEHGLIRLLVDGRELLTSPLFMSSPEPSGSLFFPTWRTWPVNCSIQGAREAVLELVADEEAPDAILPPAGFTITFCIVIDGFLEIDGAGNVRGDRFMLRHMMN